MDQQQYTTLMDVLKHVPDPRKRQGRRHRWLTLLCLIVAAMASAQPPHARLGAGFVNIARTCLPCCQLPSRACRAKRPCGVPWHCSLSPIWSKP
jgi:hypothetical protein